MGAERIVVPQGVQGKEYVISIKMRYGILGPELAFGTNMPSVFETIGVLEAVKNQMLSGKSTQSNIKETEKKEDEKPS